METERSLNSVLINNKIHLHEKNTLLKYGLLTIGLFGCGANRFAGAESDREAETAIA